MSVFTDSDDNKKKAIAMPQAFSKNSLKKALR